MLMKLSIALFMLMSDVYAMNTAVISQALVTDTTERAQVMEVVQVFYPCLDQAKNAMMQVIAMGRTDESPELKTMVAGMICATLVKAVAKYQSLCGGTAQLEEPTDLAQVDYNELLFRAFIAAYSHGYELRLHNQDLNEPLFAAQGRCARVLRDENASSEEKGWAQLALYEIERELAKPYLQINREISNKHALFTIGFMIEEHLKDAVQVSSEFVGALQKFLQKHTMAELRQFMVAQGLL